MRKKLRKDVSEVLSISSEGGKAEVEKEVKRRVAEGRF